jgi:transposase-like protein
VLASSHESARVAGCHRTIAELARELGVSNATLYSWAHHHNIPIRPGGRRPHVVIRHEPRRHPQQVAPSRTYGSGCSMSRNW